MRTLPLPRANWPPTSQSSGCEPHRSCNNATCPCQLQRTDQVRLAGATESVLAQGYWCPTRTPQKGRGASPAPGQLRFGCFVSVETVSPRLVLNSWQSSCFSFLSTQLESKCQHSPLKLFVCSLPHPPKCWDDSSATTLGSAIIYLC